MDRSWTCSPLPRALFAAVRTHQQTEHAEELLVVNHVQVTTRRALVRTRERARSDGKREEGPTASRDHMNKCMPFFHTTRDANLKMLLGTSGIQPHSGVANHPIHLGAIDPAATDRDTLERGGVAEKTKDPLIVDVDDQAFSTVGDEAVAVNLQPRHSPDGFKLVRCVVCHVE